MSDKWLDWLARGRDAGQVEVRRRALEVLAPIRDRVMAAAGVGEGDVVLDVGTGQGLLGLAAIERVGASGHVIFTDVSQPAIDALREGLASQAPSASTSFVTTSAETLEGVQTGSVDCAVIRSVLIYVDRRQAALGALRRVVREGGSLSLYEPLDSLYPSGPRGDGSFFGWQVAEVGELAERVSAAYLAETSLGSSAALLSLSLRELPDLAEAAGFDDVRFTVEGQSLTCPPGDDHAVHAVLHGRPNPNAPSPAELAAELLNESEATAFLAAVASAVRQGRGRQRYGAIYLSAR